ncbi:MAG: CoA-binding protein [Bacteroidota bacterium]
MITTLVIGASENPQRYSYLAVKRLLKYQHAVNAIGLKTGRIDSVTIDTGFPDYKNIHTITLYINPSRQPAYYDYILSLHPKRVIFNPGTENPEFEILLVKNNIEAVEACTLVMLSTNQYER